MYSLANVLVDPYQEGVESVLGSLVYFGNSPQEVLKRANEGLCYAEFTDFDEGGFFVDDDESGPFQCIIPKTDLSYRKFNGMEEFLEYASDYKATTPYEDYLFKTGIWLKSYSGEIFQVIRINGTGVSLGGCFFYWSDLLSDYMFLDGRRCGVYE